jgi:hypothetical protein
MRRRATTLVPPSRRVCEGEGKARVKGAADRRAAVHRVAVAGDPEEVVAMGNPEAVIASRAVRACRGLWRPRRR